MNGLTTIEYDGVRQFFVMQTINNQSKLNFQLFHISICVFGKITLGMEMSGIVLSFTKFAHLKDNQI